MLDEITVAAWFRPGTHNAIILLKGAADRSGNAGEYGLVYFPNNEFFKGNVDEVRIYNRRLSAAEVSNLYLRCPLTNGFVQPVELPYLAKVGFSNLSEGDQDVTEFYQDETIYIRVRDVDIEDTGSVKITFYPPRSNTFSVTLTRNSDGTYTGSIPARRFKKPGKVTVQITGTRGRGLKLLKFTELTIRAASVSR